MTTQTADEKFLKKILFALVAATLAAGTLAGIASVNAGAQAPNVMLFDYQTRLVQ